MRDADQGAVGVLVGLAADDVHDQPGRVGLEVGDVECGELAAPQRRGEGQQQQRPVADLGGPVAGPQVRFGTVCVASRMRSTSEVHSGGAPRWVVPRSRRSPRSTPRIAGAPVGSSCPASRCALAIADKRRVSVVIRVVAA